MQNYSGISRKGTLSSRGRYASNRIAAGAAGSGSGRGRGRSVSSNALLTKDVSLSSSKLSLHSAQLPSSDDTSASTPDTIINVDCDALEQEAQSEPADKSADKPKPRSTFTKPRMNRSTAMRIQRSQNNNQQQQDALDKGAAVQNSLPSPRVKKLEIKTPSACSMNNSEAAPITVRCPSPCPKPKPTICREKVLTPKKLPLIRRANKPDALELCPRPVESLHKRLEQLQSEFLKQVHSSECHAYKGHMHCSYKMITMIQNDDCRLLVDKDELRDLPSNLPVESIADLKRKCRQVFEAGCNALLDLICKEQNNSEYTREQLQAKLEAEVNTRLAAINTKIDSMGGKNPVEQYSQRQLKELRSINEQQSAKVTTLETQILESKKLLEASRKQNKDLALDLAENNRVLQDRNQCAEDLRLEIKQLNKINKVMQQRLKESEELLEQKGVTEFKLQEALQQLDEMTTQKDSLMLRLSAKEKLCADGQQQQKQLETLRQQLETHKELKEQHPIALAKIVELQSELDLKTQQLESHLQTEQQLRLEQQQALEQLILSESKLHKLEEQIEHHRQVLAVRGERIHFLDQELKQREEAANRKISEMMGQASDKNTIITQIKNELASTNEQFQNLCSTLSVKQTKLHSQEHVIKLLEESNARSIKLHTKLGEKNSLLKEEVENLRRTVNSLMLGSDVSDMEVSEILLE
ncbi:median body protein isoform X2 [Drosophila busckii]|uniref:median body protein isoform X2 n=1 Tax=Drosophila busckii TaxID=30019 RepID=UPI00083E99B1|nr:median body protein isoform X2 [Drosophila busckii]